MTGDVRASPRSITGLATTRFDYKLGIHSGILDYYDRFSPSFMTAWRTFRRSMTAMESGNEYVVGERHRQQFYAMWHSID